MPLRLRGSVSRALAFEREGSSWRAASTTMCTFMPLRGIADDPRGDIALAGDGHVVLHVHRDQDADREALARVLDHPPAPVFTGVHIAARWSFEWLDLWLACTLPGGLSQLSAVGPAVRSGLVKPPFFWGAMAAVEHDSIAYLTLRADGGSTAAAAEPEAGDKAGERDANGGGEADKDKVAEGELGVIGHGPRGRELAERTAAQIRAWARDYRSRQVTIRLAQGAAREGLAGQFVIDKPHSRITVTWD